MNIIEIEDNKNNIIKKHNYLVKNARYSLSEQGIKIISALISMIKVSDKDFQEYHLNINKFKTLINTSSNDIYRQVDKLTNELMSKPFKVGFKKFNWCYMSEYKKGEATIIMKIAPELKPYLLELKQDFLQYNIKDILSLKSSYVIRFYELIISYWNVYKKYNNKSKSYTLELEISKIRDLFQIPNSYLYKDIRVNIVDKAQKQFKEKTNIKFTYKEQKLGRKVVRLQIIVEDNKKGSNDILSTKKLFINYIREEYKPDPNNNIFPIIISTQNGDLKVNLQGEIYLSGADNNKNYNSKSSNQLWGWLYKLAKEDLKNLSNPKEKN